MKLDKFHVVTMISNPIRFTSRYRIFKQWEEMILSTGCNLTVVELAFGERPHEITESSKANHLQLRSSHEIWHKENALNAGFSHALKNDPDGKYFCFIDADVFPMRPPKDWLLETYEQLQHFSFVQMFETAIDLNPSFNPMGRVHHSFMSQYIKSGYKMPTGHGKWNYVDGHPGFAWALRREALDAVGGVIDVSILGAGDRAMCLALIGLVERATPIGITDAYKEELLRWQDRANKHIKRNVGYVPGAVYHYWHGKKKDRGYTDRWKILLDNKYNPKTDLKKDSQGLWQLVVEDDRQIMLRDQIRSYFRSRNEDSIDME